jgi:hypothetical protein
VKPITLSLAAAAAACLAAPACAAGEEQTFAAFRALCADTAADYPAVVARADADGWKPAAIMADTMKGVSVTDKTSRTKTFGDFTLTLFAWRGVTPTNVKVSDCKVGVERAGFADLQARAQTWLAMAPQQATPQQAIFHFTDAGPAHKAITSAEYEAAAAGAGLDILTVTAEGAGATLDLLKIKR